LREREVIFQKSFNQFIEMLEDKCYSDLGKTHVMGRDNRGFGGKISKDAISTSEWRQIGL
jgi:DNA-binding ferritin-like protein (Dps family)